MWDSHKCEVLKNERKTGKVLNKNLRLSRMWERLKNSQQECEVLTNVRFSKMWVCVWERERERENFFSQEFFAIVNVCKESQKRSFCNNNSFTCNVGTQYSNTPPNIHSLQNVSLPRLRYRHNFCSLTTTTTTTCSRPFANISSSTLTMELRM
jgi:hypothetical protein